MKSSEVAAVKNATKKVVTTARNTNARNSQTNKAASGQNTKGIQTAAAKFLNASTSPVLLTKSLTVSGKIKSSAAKVT